MTLNWQMKCWWWVVLAPAQVAKPHQTQHWHWLHVLRHLNSNCTIYIMILFKRKLFTQGDRYTSFAYNKKPYLQLRIIIIKHNNIVLVLASKPSEIIPALLTTDNQLHCYLGYNLDLNEIQREDNLCKHWAMFKCNLIIAEYCQVFDCSLVQWR